MVRGDGVDDLGIVHAKALDELRPQIGVGAFKLVIDGLAHIVQVGGEANLDLRALAAAIPSLLRLREGVEITGGQLRISKVQVRTRPALAAVHSVPST